MFSLFDIIFLQEPVFVSVSVAGLSMSLHRGCMKKPISLTLQ
jgi:hypothetical protein